MLPFWFIKLRHGPFVSCGLDASMTSFPVIAILDDDEPLRDAIENLLQSSGFATIKYSSAERFLTERAEANVSLIISDVRMGNMSGLDLQAVLLLRKIDIPIIFVSAFFEGEVAAHALENGASACLRKPFDDRDLLAAIHAALNKGASTDCKGIHSLGISE
jgi:FixJ family two-component response regulator